MCWENVVRGKDREAIRIQGVQKILLYLKIKKLFCVLCVSWYHDEEPKLCSCECIRVHTRKVSTILDTSNKKLKFPIRRLGNIFGTHCSWIEAQVIIVWFRRDISIDKIDTYIFNKVGR